MAAGIRRILVGVTYEPAEEDDSSAFAFGLSLAKAVDAQLTVQASSLMLTAPSSMISRFAPSSIETGNNRRRQLAVVAEECARTASSIAGVVYSSETPHLPYEGLLERLTLQARVHDLTILDAEPIRASPDRGYIEAAIFESGHPAIIVPPDTLQFSARRVAVAWDGGARAARALNDALPLLRNAEHVAIVSVTGEKDLSKMVRGHDVTSYLAAHGVKAELKNLPIIDGDAAATIRRHILDTHIHLLVMGAHTYSWAREFLLGSMTQSFLRSAPVPLFMSY